ncbi:hypothetical protein CAC42_1169 [Sphaceloma murrayae]|uniref:Uncharacterized protein n=1 Tax=Sphaceloma murrayae TaxID=2082308 RepID=A0A2K1R297_9PEZI|nr:hypothetical protein CAC42_1169 [Sphaceloma murrayae]
MGCWIWNLVASGAVVVLSWILETGHRGMNTGMRWGDAMGSGVRVGGIKIGPTAESDTASYEKTFPDPSFNHSDTKTLIAAGDGNFLIGSQPTDSCTVTSTPSSSDVNDRTFLDIDKCLQSAAE